ncbi:MAG TPA: MerR family transcriptional regulator [Candidatus Angelobacter sp.]|nr:MerR family transcriptional regulator [Candidatus Angelobacter sp.]
MDRQYKVREFAEFAGVTVRALHHYERLGLLKPTRTGAGYRVYGLGDLERLEQIVALRFLGLPLRQIKALLDRDPLRLADALQVQLTILEEKRQLLDRAIGAIRDGVTGAQPDKPALLKKIIGAIKMQNSVDFREKYFSKEAWAKLTRLKEQSTPASRLQLSRKWISLLCDVESALETDPAGKKAQALAARWVALTETESHGDRGIQAGRTKAWLDRQHWPAESREHIASYDLEKIAEFIGNACASPMKKYYSKQAWAKLMRHLKDPAEREGRSQARAELYRETAAALKEGPRSERGQSLARRSAELFELESGGDAGIKAGGMKAMADRKNWPAWMKRQVASRYQMSFEAFDRVAKFLDRATAGPGKLIAQTRG